MTNGELMDRIKNAIEEVESWSPEKQKEAMNAGLLDRRFPIKKKEQ